MARERPPRGKSDASAVEREASDAALNRARLRGIPLVGDLKQAAADAGWSVNESLREYDEIPRYALGGRTENLVPAAQTPPIDFTDLSFRVPANPLLAERWLELGFLHPDVEDVAREIATGAEARRRAQATRAQEKQDRGDT